VPIPRKDQDAQDYHPLAVALTAAGCNASSTSDDSEPTASTIPTSSAAETATVEQWASLIATHERDWRDQAETVEENCLDPATLFACTLGYQTLSLKAQTIEIMVDGAATNPDSDNYLGEPSAEVSDLVGNLIEAAGAVEPAVTAWQETGCEDPLSLDCGVVESLEMDRAVGDLTQAFDSWAPYL
jgi:hypothetical protein